MRIFENRVLKNIVGPKRDEVREEYRRLHNEELNGQYSSPNIIRVTKSRRMRWTGNVAYLGRGYVETVEETDHLEDLRIDERIIFKWNFMKRYRGMYWINPVRVGTGGGILCLRY